MTIYKSQLKYLVTIPFCLLFLIPIPLCGQNNIDYISDWYYIFFSQNDLITISKQIHSDEKSVDKKNKIILNSKFSINDFYREKTDKLIRKLYYWQQVNDFNIPLIVLGQNISLNAYSQFVSKLFDYDINSFESFKITHNSKKYIISLSTELWKNYISLLTGIGTRIQSSNSKIIYHLGIQFSLNDENIISFVRNTDYFNWNYKFGFQDPAIILNVSENIHMNELNLQLQLISNLTLKGLMQNIYVNQDQNIDTKKTMYLPIGIWYSQHMNFEYSYKKLWIFEFGYKNHQSNLHGRFYELKQSFGKITKSNDFSETYSPGISYTFNHNTLGINFSWGKGYLVNRGHIESWPFTSTWIDLLGLRYNFNSKIEYNFNRYLINYRLCISDWDIAFNCAYEILSPSGDTRTWEPEFLVFGIKNLKVYDFIYSSQKGIYLMLNISKKLSDWLDLQYRFSQYIPVKSVKSNNFSNSTFSRSNKSKSIYGGGKHQIYFSFNF